MAHRILAKACYDRTDIECCWKRMISVAGGDAGGGVNSEVAGRQDG